MSSRDRLIDAMSTSLRERGFGSSAIKDVLERADATAGSMYHFFPNGKDELAAAAVRQVGLAGTEALAGILDQSDSVAEAAVVFYEALIADMEASGFKYGCPIGVPSTEAAFTVETVREAGAAVFSAWITTMAEALEAEGWDPDSAVAAARFSVCAYEGASTVARASRDTSIMRDTLRAVGEVLSRPRDLSAG